LVKQKGIYHFESIHIQKRKRNYSHGFLNRRGVCYL
jgi:hypothetical protein